LIMICLTFNGISLTEISYFYSVLNFMLKLLLKNMSYNIIIWL